MMDFSRVTRQLLTERLDAEFYRPAFLANDKLLRALGVCVPLSEATTEIQLGYTGPTEEYYSDGRSGAYYLSSKNIVDGWVELTDGTDRISVAAHNNQLRKTQVRSGDLLISRTGSVGKCAVLFDSTCDYNIAAHLIALRINHEFDSAFLGAFFNSMHGNQQSVRLQRGTIIHGLSVYDVPEMLVPRFSAGCQRYIGYKVRQAERLHSRARVFEARVAKIHANYITLPVGIDFSKRTRRLPSRDLTERLDAHFYPAAVEQYFKQVVGQPKSLEKLTFLVSNGQTQREAEVGVLQATVTNLGRSFLEGELRTVERPSGDSRMLSAHDLLLCNAAHNKSYIGRDVTYCQTDAGVYPSTEVMVLRVDREQVPASFVRQYLKSDIGFLQIQSTIRGITAHSYPGDVRLIKVPVPDVPTGERAAWFATDDQMLRAGQCVDAAKLLTAAATQLVELLIEGERSEADFVAAQKGLEAGDQTLDRAVLQTLRRGGNGDGPALFSDLEAFYALLDEVDKAGGGG
jgi:type I restriction enzyme S subunit